MIAEGFPDIMGTGERLNTVVVSRVMEIEVDLSGSRTDCGRKQMSVLNRVWKGQGRCRHSIVGDGFNREERRRNGGNRTRNPRREEEEEVKERR